MKFSSPAFVSDDPAELVDGLTSQILGSGEQIDLAVAFVNSSDPARAAELIPNLRESVDPKHFLACTAGGVIGGGREIEDQAAVTIAAGSLPGIALSPFHLDESDIVDSIDNPDAFKMAVGIDDDPKVFIILAEPFSTPTSDVLTAFNQAYPGIPLVGGIASAGSSPGMNVLAVDDRIHTSGAVGLALSGNLDVDVIVSQGCQGIGPLLQITESDRNLITSLDGRPPLESLRRIFGELDSERKGMVENGLLIGIAADSAEEDPGPGDFLIRNIAGANPSTGALAVTDIVEPRQLVRFFVRDAQTATDDLELLLSPQAFTEPPSMALLFSCNGRGKRLFERPDGDISVVKKALGDDLPVTGFFCAGEIGPIRSINHIHGQTASLVLLRPAQR
jgi:small ligand-binding sensory domain FIST